MDIRPQKTVTLKIGATSHDNAPIPLTIAKPPMNRVQTAILRHHESVADLLDNFKIPTDGSQVVLKPGTAEPFDWDDDIYSAVDHGTELLVVPNRPDQLGKDAVQAPQIPSKVAAARVAHRPADAPVAPATQVSKPLVPPVGHYPKTLKDTTGAGRPNVIVRDEHQEGAARSMGFTVEVSAAA